MDSKNEREPIDFTPNSGDLNYHNYLRIDELLDLQKLQSEPPHHDEMLFIIIHQAYELWFKLVLHELDAAVKLMRAANVLMANHFLTRVVEIFRILVPQIHILETMTPMDFLEFRNRLVPASGFQSIQFREIEFMAGLRDERYIEFLKKIPGAQERLKAKMTEPDLQSIYFEMLVKLGFDLPDSFDNAYLESHPKDEEKVLNTLAQIYREPNKNMPLYLLSESLVDFDEQLGLWRDHHVRTVERIIGFKHGTGGSPGAKYLRSTTSKQCFPYLWKVRGVL